MTLDVRTPEDIHEMSKTLLFVLSTMPWVSSSHAATPIMSYLYSSSGIFGARYSAPHDSSWGFWGEFKFNAPHHSPRYETISRRTVESVFNDPFREESIQHLNLSGGAALVITEAFSLYGGVGWAVATPWRRYFDSTGILGGNSGDYWIRDDEKNSLNVCGGATVRVHSAKNTAIYASLGLDTSPPGVVFGIGLGF
jgi:hypothetical protein